MLNPFALPVHPAVVHFPIALLFLAWVALLVHRATGEDEWRDRSWLLELSGTLLLPVAIASAIVDTRGVRFLLEPRWDGPLIWHALIGVGATAVFGLHVWLRRGRGELVDLGAVTVGVWLIVLGGLIGGEMVFGA
jgi:uncharacterized membrane protein